MHHRQLTFETLTERFIDYCESKNLVPSTIRWYRQHLGDAASFLSGRCDSFAVATPTDLRDWITQMLGSLSPGTVNHKITTLKTFYRFLADEELIKSDPTLRLPKVKAQTRLIKPFSEEQVTTLLAIPNTRRFAGARDRTLMMLLLDTALRISEAVNVRLGDIDWTRNVIRVMGKGGKERVVPFGAVMRSELRGYLDRRGSVDTDAVFITEYGIPISVSQIQENINAYGKKAGLANVRVSPHTFRHTAAVNWIRNGGDVFSLQRLLGHTSLEMVRRYCNLANEDLERAHKVCSPVDRMLRSQQHERTPRKRLR